MHFSGPSKDEGSPEEELQALRRSKTRLGILAALGWICALVGWSLFFFGRERVWDLGSWSFEALLEGDESRAGSADFKVTPLHAWLPEPRHSSMRQLASAATDHGGADADGSTTAHSEHAAHAVHSYEAIGFLLLAIAVGAIIWFVTTIHMFQGLQQTVALFIAGIICALVNNAVPDESKHSVWKNSYEMWMGIDPHLLLFTMLPSLLMADAMTIDTNVAQRVAAQCVYLAGPGVLVSALLTAAFLYFYLPYQWPFMLCLTAGSILCATDPVAVVALLKELGASPVLTVQIQGEALLNDGTAIVLYLLAYNMLSGVTYDVSDSAIFLIKTVCFAVATGLVIGFITYLWMRKISNKFDHTCGIIQCVLTVGCAYASFFLAEGVFSASGVLSTVAAALVLADKMRPTLVDEDSLMSFWHVFEYTCNSLIFFLAGALTGNAMVKIESQDWLHLFVIYLVLLILRLLLLVGSLPLLKSLSPDNRPVTVAEAMVMTWGGLRGAVGLSLAIQVANNRAGGNISQEDGNRVLFYVGGVATLTLVINATTCPFVVDKLGITQWGDAKQQMMLLLHKGLQIQAKSFPYSRYIGETLVEMHHLISKQASRKQREAAEQERVVYFGRTATDFSGPHQMERSGSRRHYGSSIVRTVAETVGTGLQRVANVKEVALQAGLETIDSWREARLEAESWRERLEATNNREGEDVMALLDQMPLVDELEQANTVLESDQLKPQMVRKFNEALLKVVRHHYWDMISQREIGEKDGKRLLLSLSMAQSNPSHELEDLEALSRVFADYYSEYKKKIALRSNCKQIGQDRDPTCSERCDTRLHGFVDSLFFNGAMTLFILGSVAVAQYEDSLTGEISQQSRQLFLTLEFVFLGVFFLEFLLKVSSARLMYFRDLSNIFDLVLLLLGVVGLVFTMLTVEKNEEGSGDNVAVGAAGDASTQARILRTARVFRVLRLMRLVRLYKIAWKIWSLLMYQESLDSEAAESMAKISLTTAFMKAHIKAQADFALFFANDGDLDREDLAEFIRVVMQSQTQVCIALKQTLQLKEELREQRRSYLKNVVSLQTSREGVLELEHCVMRMHGSGVLGSSDAETLLHPVHEQLSAIASRLTRAYQGHSSAFLSSDDDAQRRNHGANDHSTDTVVVNDLNLTRQRNGSDDSTSGLPSDIDSSGQDVDGPVINTAWAACSSTSCGEAAVVSVLPGHPDEQHLARMIS